MSEDDFMDSAEWIVVTSRKRKLHDRIVGSGPAGMIPLDMCIDTELSDLAFRMLAYMVITDGLADATQLSTIFSCSTAAVDQAMEIIYDIGYFVEDGEQ